MPEVCAEIKDRMRFAAKMESEMHGGSAEYREVFDRVDGIILGKIEREHRAGENEDEIAAAALGLPAIVDEEAVAGGQSHGGRPRVRPSNSRGSGAFTSIMKDAEPPCPLAPTSRPQAGGAAAELLARRRQSKLTPPVNGRATPSAATAEPRCTPVVPRRAEPEVGGGRDRADRGGAGRLIGTAPSSAAPPCAVPRRPPAGRTGPGAAGSRGGVLGGK